MEKIPESTILPGRITPINNISKESISRKQNTFLLVILKFFETLFKNIDYKIEKVHKQDDETSIVTVEIKNVDMQKMFLQVFQNMLKGAFSKDGSKRPLSVEEVLKEELESKDKPKSKHTTQFVVKKTADGEKIVVTAENIDVLLGKLNTALSNLNTLGMPKEEAVELPETGPSTGLSQKPEELRNQKK